MLDIHLKYFFKVHSTSYGTMEHQKENIQGKKMASFSGERARFRVGLAQFLWFV